MKRKKQVSNRKKFKPKLDKSFILIWIPTALIMLTASVFAAFEPIAFLIIIPTDIFTFYILFSSLSGYAELRENTLFVKFGFILKRDIPYDRIRTIKKERKFYSDSMLSLKNALEHVTIRYNRFDMICISVKDNDEFIRELALRIKKQSCP